MKNVFVNFAICLFLLSSIGCENYSGQSGSINPYSQRQSPVVIDDPNRVIRPQENWTVLHQAADDQNFPLVKTLVEQGADVRAKARQPWLAGGYGPYNQTPAVVALRWGRTDIARYLTDRSGEDYDQIKADMDRLAAKGRAAAIKDTLDAFDIVRKIPPPIE